jgi:sugar lactone lactonase YvrE
MTRIEVAVQGRDTLGEVPLWCTRTKRLWWLDVRKPALQSYDPVSHAHDVFPIPGKVAGSFAFRERGGVVLGVDTALNAFDPQTGKLERLVDLEPGRPQNRLNDAKCDRRGRFWVGSMNDAVREPHGSFYRVAPDLSVRKCFNEIIIPNAVAFSPDDRTLYFADTLASRIWAFDFDLAAGEISNRRVFADMSGNPGQPDGATVDAEGFLWNAEYGGSRVVRYAPNGRTDRIIDLPVSQPTSCGFGGEKLDILFVTSAAQELSEKQLAAQPLAGSLFALDVGVRGLVEPPFAG